MRIFGLILLGLGVAIIALGKPTLPSLAIGLPIGFVGVVALTGKSKSKGK